VDRQYVGIDFHRRRSVVVRIAADGARLGVHWIVNEPFELVRVIGLCGESPEVVIEAIYGWFAELTRFPTKRSPSTATGFS
jgi:hypothetical protein